MSDIGHYDKHPAYKNFCLLVGDDTKWGRDRNQSPNLEAEIGRFIMPWFGATFLPTGDDRGVNPASHFYDWFTDTVAWLAQPDSLLDTTTFNAVLAAFDDFPISVDIEEQSDGRAIFAKLAEYGDFWLRRNGAKIELGYWQQGNIDTSTLPVLGSKDLVGEPRMLLTGYEDCYTEVKVAFKDREHYYNDAIAIAFNNGLRRIIGQHRSITLQRDWLTDAALAQQYAQQWLQRFSRPGGSGEQDALLDSIEAIEDDGNGPICGRLVKLDSASLEEEIVVRVTRCKYPADSRGACTLTIDVERSIWPVLFIQPPPGKIGNFIVGVPAVVNYDLWELPSGLKNGTGIEIAVLAQRPAPNILGFHVWSSLDDDIYVEANPPSTFAAYGKIVDETYLSTRDTIDTTLGMHVELFGVDLVPTQTDAQRDDYNLLAFVGIPGVDVFPEILSVGQVVALGAGKYKIFTRSALYGTVKHGHNIGTTVFFIARDHLTPVANKNFVVGVELFFKLQTFDSRQTFDLADFDSFAYTFIGGAVSVPTALDLDTTFVITSENKVDSRITATWSFVPDQHIVGFNVRCKKATFDSNWVTLTADLSATQTFKGLEPNILYEVQVQAVAATGEPSDWSASETITTAAPNVPGTPTSLTLTPGVASIRLSWVNATTGGIRGTQILFSVVAGDDAHLVNIDEVPVGQNSYVHPVADALIGISVFYAVRHINTVEVEGTRTAAVNAKPLSDAPVTKLPQPFIAKSDLEGGTAGDADYRLQIVNTSASQAADLEFSYNKTTWFAYSETGDYRDGISGSVIPTAHVGEVSLSAGGQLFARQKQDGYLTSDLAEFYNNTSKTPHSDGTGGGDGTAGKNPA